MKPTVFLLTLVASLSGPFSFGQATDVISQGSYWMRYYGQLQLDSIRQLHVEVDERRLLNPDRQAQFFMHVHFHQKFRAVDVALGFNTNLANSNKNWALKVPEFRPWQEVSWFALKSASKSLQLRYRLEERFIHANNSEVLLPGYDWNLRHRFRIQFIRTLTPISQKKSWYAKVSSETMVATLGKTNHTFDQHRLSLSFEKVLSPAFSFEFGYVNLFQSRSAGGYYDRHVARITFYHRMTLK